MAGQLRLLTPAGGAVVLDTATTTATDVTVKVPVTGVNNGTLVCSDSSGNVGIGTSSPSQKLHVYNSASATAARFQTTSAAATIIEFADNGTTVAPNIGCRGNAISFGTDSSERMRIDSSGNLLVGTTSNGNGSKVKIDAGSVYALETVRNSTGDSWHLIFANPNGIVGRISTSASSTSYVTSSDYRLKENIQPMQGALATVAQLNPVTYTWKVDGSDGQGFIAHELQAVVPDCVTGEKDAVDAEGNPVYQGIDTSFLVATLTKAIQELSAKNDALEARLAALEAK